MSIVIKRYSEDISSSIDRTSVLLTQVLTKEVSRLEFLIRNYSGKATCSLGAVIDVYEDATHKFGGTVTEKQDIVQGGILIGTKYLVNDHSFRLNSKLVVRRYDSEDPQEIVNDIVASFTDGTFGTTGVVLGGFDVPSIKFNYEQVTVALEKLAKQIGWEWYVDADKELQFFPPSTVVNAPYIIDDTSGNLEWATLDIEQSVINMKNSIFVIGGTYTKIFTALTTPDVYLTDGIKSVFTIAYPYSESTIEVTLDGASQTIGIDQVDDPGSFNVLYNEKSRFIKFTSVPATGKTVKVFGSAQIPIIAHVSDQVAIDVYGEIQDVVIDDQIKSTEEAQERGNAQLSQFGSPVYAVKFSTLQTGFAVGQTVSVDSNLFGTDVLVMVKRITGRMKSSTQMIYDIECVGTEKVNFIDIMKLLLMRANANAIIDDSTVLQVLLLFNEFITASDTLGTPSTSTGPYKWSPGSNDLIWNFGTWS